ncbi:hypothetical protein LINGRAHAP2_LOCUS15658 [Linum grandiflorum]
MRVELCALVGGLRLAWNSGARKVAAQTNPVAATILLQQQDHPEHQHAHMALQFQELLRRDWEVQLFHIYREGKFFGPPYQSRPPPPSGNTPCSCTR